MAGLERGMGSLYGYLKNSFRPVAGARIAGIRAGISTGVSTLVRNIKEKRRDNHEST
jgi:hypothetical protein